MKTTISLIAMALLFCLPLASQSSDYDTFLLKKTGSHYVFETKINNKAKATCLMESGIHALLIDSLYAFSNSKDINLNFVKNVRTQRMNLGGRKYYITHTAKGKVRLGNNTTYEGEIFVLSNFRTFYDIAVPIQNISNSNDGSRIIRLDMKNYSLQVVDRKQFNSKTNDWQTADINYDTYMKMPGVRTELVIRKGGKEYSLPGNFVLDLGNASFLYLMRQSRTVQDFLKNNTDIEIQKAYNTKGIQVGEAIVAEHTVLCNRNFNGQIIAITSVLPKFTTEGSIGLKFFDGSVTVFDFDNSKLYIM